MFARKVNLSQEDNLNVVKVGNINLKSQIITNNRWATYRPEKDY